ncbi:H-NS histone family protein [Aromatoleum bremense]|nr:H-NS histone family protein [Aromatoleum bremense]
MRPIRLRFTTRRSRPIAAALGLEWLCRLIQGHEIPGCLSIFIIGISHRSSNRSHSITAVAPLKAVNVVMVGYARAGKIFANNTNGAGVMSTYQEILAQIEALKQQAEEMRQAEIADVIADIRQKITDYNLSAADLGFGAPARAEKPAAGKRGTVKAKYRNPATGTSWSGRGVMPKWLKAELDAGKAKEAFLIADEGAQV